MGLRVKKSFLVDCHDLDAFIESVYGRGYSSLRTPNMEDKSNNAIETIEVTEDPEEIETYSEDPEGDLAEWLERPIPDTHKYSSEWWAVRDNCPSIETMFWDPRRKGLIEPGTYVINLWW